MSPEFLSVIGTGIVILIAVAASNRSLRREMSALGARIDRLGERVDVLSEWLGDVRERLGRVEGLLEGLGLTRREPSAGVVRERPRREGEPRARRKRAGKRRDENHPTPPRP